ncbi:MAG: carboxypeptidase-like regulatory domain-containing protein, partial [Novosphingobium sp.]
MKFHSFLKSATSALAVGTAVVAVAGGLAAVPAYAQETSTSVRGTVMSAGTPVAGATIVITHVPSNTTQTVVSGPDGSFVLSGLRAGGPYTVKISAPGYDGASITDVYTALGAP